MAKLIISDEYKALKYDFNRGKNKTGKRRPFKGVIFIITILLISIVMVSLLASNTFGAGTGYKPKEVIIKNGDCLWDIAKKYSDGKDIRKVIYDIEKFNNMENGDVYPGMIILIPEL